MSGAYYFHRTLLPSGGWRMGFVRMGLLHESSVRQAMERDTQGIVITLWRLPAWLGAALDVASGYRWGRIDGATLAEFLRDFGLMQEAGIAAIDALRTLAAESEGAAGSAKVARLAAELEGDLQLGMSLAEAMARHDDWFPETVVNLVRIGEQTGNVGIMLRQAAEHIERLQQIKRDVRTALIYPVFVFASLFAVAAFWIIYVIPNLAKLFRQLQAELPAITRATVVFAEAVVAHLPMVTAIVLVSILGYVWALGRFESVARLTHQTLHHLPVVRRLVVASGMALMTEHLALLVRAGVDMVSAMDILVRTTRDRFYRQRLQRLGEALRRGDGVGESLRRIGGFPPMVVRMISVGEQSGSLDDQLMHLAREYRARLDALVRSLAEVLKPAIILVAGALFLFLIVSMLLPVYDLVRQTVTRNLGG